MKKRIFTVCLTLSLMLHPFFLAGCEQKALTPQKETTYELAVANGYNGTEGELLASLVGETQEGEVSAYQMATENGYEGDVVEWLEPLLQSASPDSGKQNKYPIGDIDFDGAVGANDLTVLARHVAQIEELSEQYLYTVETEGGKDGKSAYELAQEIGFDGTLEEWLDSLVGEQGPAGASAYDLAVQAGFEGSLNNWLASLVGANGADGKSAYDLAKEGGYTGTLQQWLASLTGTNGKSAYEIACDHGYQGNEEQWLTSLVGPKGEKGEDGVGVVNAYIDTDKHLILEMSDGNKIDAGYIGGSDTPVATETFTVTFKDWDGTELNKQTVNRGENATPPTDPTREGYTFTGWSGNYYNVVQNEIVTAQYTENVVVHPQITVSSNTASAGATKVTVAVSLENNPGFLTMALNIAFNDEVLTLTKVSTGVDFTDYSFTAPKNKISGCTAAWFASDLPEEILDGDIMTMQFTVASNAPKGQYSITISCPNDGSTVDGNKQAFTMTDAIGYITVN